MSKNKVKIDGTMEMSQVVKHLEDVLCGLKAGSVHVQLGAESVALQPSSIVEFEMEVSQKKEKEKISFEISWKGSDEKKDENVRISAQGPTIEVS